MPELELFRRRWHLATDSLPVMMALLCITHVVWFIPYATGYYSIEGTGLRYDCQQGTLLRVANYGLFALFALAALNEAAITVLGLRGGPFQTRKRRHVTPLLYLEIALWVLLLGFTIFATVVTYGDKVAASCWTNNPCQYDPDRFPLACSDRSGKRTPQLSDTCQGVLLAGTDLIGYCWTEWLTLAINWSIEVADSVTAWIEARDAECGCNTTAIFLQGGEAAAALDAEYDSFFNATLQEHEGCGPEGCQPGYSRALCNATIDNAYWEQRLGFEIDVSTDARNSGGHMLDLGGIKGVRDYNAELASHPNVFQWVNGAIVQVLEEATGITAPRWDEGNGSYGYAAWNMPWFSCLPDAEPYDCQSWTFISDECEDWASILALPDPKDRKHFFEVVVITSWVILGITALTFYLCFNAFPSYDDVDAWEGTVKSMAGMCCFGGAVSGSVGVAGGSDLQVSHEIAKSLHILFGGIDLDPTDRLLGIYLVSERQHRRRQQDVASALEGAGYALHRRQSRVGAALTRLRRRPTGGAAASGSLAAGSRSLGGGSAAAGGGSAALWAGSLAQGGSAEAEAEEAPLAVPLGAGANGSAAAAAAAEQQQQQQRRLQQQLSAGKLPPSPFDSAAAPAAAEAAAGGSAGSAGAAGDGGRMMLYQHSMLRLRSNLANLGRGPAFRQTGQASLAALEEGRSAEDGGAAAPLHPEAEPELALSPSSAADAAGGAAAAAGGKPLGSTSSSRAPPPTGWSSKVLHVTARFHPLLTPSGCAGRRAELEPPLSPQAAAEIYAGKLDSVPPETIQEAKRVSRFAVAAYGLQSVIWAKGQRPAMCLANANRLVKCFKRPFGLEAKFRKANFDTIMEMTGVAPADLLYVSYTNVAGGVLPYLIMLDRPSKSVVLSVRGTVSMEDLITDLLSDPVDVGDWVPEWVAEAAAARRAAGTEGDASGDRLKAHIGIVSSATAVLRDMEERGLLKELLLSKLLRTSTLAGRPSADVVTQLLSTLQSVPIPALPRQQPPMSRGGAAGEAPSAAGTTAAATAAAAAAAAAAEGEGDETQGAAFQQAERQHLRRLESTRDGSAEVVLPLERAQTLLRSKLQLDGWKVVVTGHSLGAAVACMLAMQLRQRFSDVQCWAFNPPGGLVSWELSQIAQTYCTSIVVGKDLISRLSFNTSKRVVDEMVVSLARCTRPKLAVAADIALGRRKRAGSTPRTFCSLADIGPEAVALVEGYYRTSHLHMQSADTTEMYPPGRLVFLRPFKGRKKAQTVWDAVWIDAATLISEGILVTPSMTAHHRLFVLADAFQSILAGEAATQAAAQEEQGEDEVPQGVTAIAHATGAPV